MNYLLEYEEWEELNEDSGIFGTAVELLVGVLKEIGTQRPRMNPYIVLYSIISLLSIASIIGSGVTKSRTILKSGGQSITDNRKLKRIVKDNLTREERVKLYLGIKSSPKMFKYTALLRKTSEPKKRKELIEEMMAYLFKVLSDNNKKRLKTILEAAEKEGIIDRGYSSPVYYQNKFYVTL